MAILASPPRVSDDESEEEEELEGARRKRSGLDASSSSLSRSLPRRSAPLFPADAALEALLASVAAGGVACPLNGRLPAVSIADVLVSLRPRVLFAPRRRGCAEAVAGALAAVVTSRSRDRGGAYSREDGDGNGKEGEEAFFGLPRGPEAPVVVWLDDDDDDENGETDSVFPPSSSFDSSPPFAQVSSAALLRGIARERSSSSASSFTPRFAPNDAAAIVFTSGTSSGRPRGALLSHSSLHFQSAIKRDRMRLCPADAVLLAAPLFHVAGLSAAAASLLARCRRNVLCEAGGWTRRGGWTAAVEGRVTALSAVSAMAFDLAAENEAEARRRRGQRGGAGGGGGGAGGGGGGGGGGGEAEPLSSVRVALVGGGPPPAAGLLAAAFPNPGVRVLTAYGLTEASSSVLWGEVGVGGRASSPPNSSPSSSSSLTCSPPGVEVAVAVFEESSSSAAAAPPPSSSRRSCILSWRPARKGEEGELLTRGAHVFRGYWRDAAATRAAFLSPSPSPSPDSTPAKAAAAVAARALPWLRTGDAAVRDEGNGGSSIRVLGRGADALRVGGETIHASSAEASLLRALRPAPSAASKAAVSGVAVVGLPHARLGQVVAALVALNKGVAWRGDVVVAEEGGGEQQQRGLRPPPPPPPPPAGGCGVPLSLSTLRAAGRAAGLPGHALPRRAVATWGPLPTRGPLAKLDRGEALRLVERAVGRGEEEEVDEEPRPRL